MRCPRLPPFSTPTRSARIGLRLLLTAALVSGLVTGCWADFDRPSVPRCGNGVLDPDEACDATLLDGASCESLGYRSGTLVCAADCTLDQESCEEAGFCGDGLIQPGSESCDGSLLGGATCEILALGMGDLSCDASCSLDTSQCTGVCGDESIQVGLGEVCDGSNLDGDTCASLGYADGELACAPDCYELDVSRCEEQPTGGPCDADFQCAGGICWSEADRGWPDGTCTGDCAVDACAPGMECIAQTDGDHRCYAPCTDYLDCRPGYACFDYWGSGTSYCYPLCGDDSDCPDTGTCNPYNRLCDSPETGADHGAPCTVGTDCIGGACVASWPGGYCTSFCSLTDGVCPAGTSTVCVDAALGTRGDLGACMVSCTGANDCPRPGYTCSDLFLSPESICAPE